MFYIRAKYIERYNYQNDHWICVFAVVWIFYSILLHFRENNRFYCMFEKWTFVRVRRTWRDMTAKQHRQWNLSVPAESRPQGHTIYSSRQTIWQICNRFRIWYRNEFHPSYQLCLKNNEEKILLMEKSNNKKHNEKQVKPTRRNLQKISGVVNGALTSRNSISVTVIWFSNPVHSTRRIK